MGIWKNAFKLPNPGDLSPEDKEFLISISLKVKRKSMGQISSLFMESTRPLHNLGAQSLIFLTPLLSLIIDSKKTERFVKLLENPKAVDFLIEHLNGENDGKQRP